MRLLGREAGGEEGSRHGQGLFWASEDPRGWLPACLCHTQSAVWKHRFKSCLSHLPTTCLKAGYFHPQTSVSPALHRANDRCTLWDG